MTTATETSQERRIPLSRERVLNAAVALADERGIEALSMRNLAESLGVKAMSLYNHVANKEAILDGVVDTIVAEIEEELGGFAVPEGDWKQNLRDRILTARMVMLRHPWAPGLLETRTQMSPRLMFYFDTTLGMDLVVAAPGHFLLKHMLQAAADEEHRLARVAIDVQPAAVGRLGQRGEVDPGGDVLQAGPEEGVVMGLVAIMAHQRAVATLGQVVLAARVAVIDEQGQPALHSFRQRTQAGLQRKVDLGTVAVGKPGAGVLFQSAYGPFQHRRRLARRPLEAGA